MGLLIRQRGFFTEHIDTTMDIGVGVKVILPLGLNHRHRFLRGCTAVEVNQWSTVDEALQDGKITTHGFDIECRESGL
jgi:hypothetical protein